VSNWSKKGYSCQMGVKIFQVSNGSKKNYSCQMGVKIL